MTTGLSILTMRSEADSNCCSSFCRAEPSHSAIGPFPKWRTKVGLGIYESGFTKVSILGDKFRKTRITLGMKARWDGLDLRHEHVEMVAQCIDPWQFAGRGCGVGRRHRDRFWARPWWLGGAIPWCRGCRNPGHRREARGVQMVAVVWALAMFCDVLDGWAVRKLDVAGPWASSSTVWRMW